MKFWIAAVGTILMVSQLSGQVAETSDVITRSGKVLKGAVFLMADKEAVMVKHDGAVIEKVPLEDMPEEVQKRYHYVPRTPSLDAKDRQIEELKRQLADSKKGSPAASLDSAGDAALESGGLVPLDKIAADYVANRATAEAKYRGKRFKISGTIDRIEKDMRPRIFHVFLSSTDGKTRFKLTTEFDTAYNTQRNKTGYSQTDFKIDLVENKMIGVQKTATTKGYYYDYYYYYGTRRTIDKDKSPWAPILTVGDVITATVNCAGKTVSIDFTNCAFEGLQLPFLTR